MYLHNKSQDQVKKETEQEGHLHLELECYPPTFRPTHHLETFLLNYYDEVAKF